MSRKLLEHPYAGPIEFGDQFITAREYGMLTGRTTEHIHLMAREMVFAEFGIPIVSIPKGTGRYRRIYIFYPKSRNS